MLRNLVVADLCCSYKLNKERIVDDLTRDRPRYILSAYAPERELPIQLFGGYPREQSFEELRLRHYELAFTGNEHQAILEAQTWFTSAEQQIQTALNDVEGAIKYMINGEKEHPNRLDICQNKNVPATENQRQGVFQQGNSAFGEPSTSGLRQPSTLGQQPPLFGQQKSPAGQIPAFGQSAQLGRPTTGFGQATSTFGKPSSLGPSLGNPLAPAPSFGQPSAPSAFGKLSNLGQQPAASFGNPSTLGSSEQPSAFPHANNTFGQPTGSTLSNPFGQPLNGLKSAFSQQPAPEATFGQAQPATVNPFAKPAVTAAPNVFGQSGSTTNSLSQQPVQASSAFESKSGNPLNKPPVSQNSGSSQPTHATYAGGKLKTWKGKTVTYVDNAPFIRSQDGNLEKVLFPDGPPPLTKSLDLQDELYDEATKENYAFMKERRKFKDGIMPSLAPKKEWCSWDF